MPIDMSLKVAVYSQFAITHYISANGIIRALGIKFNITINH